MFKNINYQSYMLNLLILLTMMNFMMIMYNYKFILILFMIMFLSNNKNISPIYINVFIIMLTTVISLKINFLINNNWFSMMTFLVMIGGMMIIFLYFNSFMIEEEFKILKSNFFLNFLIKIFMFSIINLIVMSKTFKMSLMFMNLKSINSNYMKFFINESILMMILNNKIIISLIIMIIYLLYALMVITFLCMNKNLSLRKII